MVIPSFTFVDEWQVSLRARTQTSFLRHKPARTKSVLICIDWFTTGKGTWQEVNLTLISHLEEKKKSCGENTLIPGTAAFSTKTVTSIKPRRLSPPGNETMMSKFLGKEITTWLVRLGDSEAQSPQASSESDNRESKWTLREILRAPQDSPGEEHPPPTADYPPGQPGAHHIIPIRSRESQSCCDHRPELIPCACFRPETKAQRSMMFSPESCR